MLGVRYLAHGGRQITLPVSFVPSLLGWVVLVGRPDGKRWWRHFRAPGSAQVWWRGAWRPTIARVSLPGSAAHRDAIDAYRQRRPRAAVSDDDPVMLITPPPPIPLRVSEGQLWRSWTGWVTTGEFVGFSVPAITAALTASLAAGAAAPLLILAGAVEGAMLGLAQGHVLARELPTLTVRRWVIATALAAAAAWGIGLLPMLTDGRLFDLPILVVIPVVAVLGAVLLGSIGTAQWLVLRHQVTGSGIWIATTAGAWAAGLLVFTAVTTPLWQPGQPIVVVAAIGVLGGLFMAGTVAALTGRAVVRLLGKPNNVPEPDDAQ
jgi:hypothetical protein